MVFSKHKDLGPIQGGFDRFAEYLLAQGLKEATAKQYESILQELAALGKKPADITAEDLRALEADMRGRLSPVTIKGKKDKIASFLQYCLIGPEAAVGEYPEAVRRAWKTRTNHAPKNGQGPMAPITKARIHLKDAEAMLGIVDRWEPHNAIRNRALIALLWDSGARASELIAKTDVASGIRIRDVKIEPGAQNGTVRLTGKTGEREVPIAYSVPYVRHWLDVHPDKKNPDAPVWATNKGPGEQGRQLHYPEAWRKIKRIMGALEADGYTFEEGCGLHAFRHGRAHHAKSKQRWSDEMMRAFFGWSRGSRMPSRYGGPAEVEDANLEFWGIKKEDREKGKLPIVACASCSRENTTTNRFCWYCGEPLTEDAVEKVKQREDEMMAALKESINGSALKESVAEHVSMMEKDLADLRQALLLVLSRESLRNSAAMIEGLSPKTESKIRAQISKTEIDASAVLERLFSKIEAPEVSVDGVSTRLDKEHFEQPKTPAEKSHVTRFRCFPNGMEFKSEGKGPNATREGHEILSRIKEGGVVVAGDDQDQDQDEEGNTLPKKRRKMKKDKEGKET